MASGITSGVAATAPSVPGLYVGTSGFSYPSWRGGFYPPEARPSEFLRHYAARLPSVELNSTFYQLPSEEQFERWAAETPQSFRFAVTMSRRATGRGRVEGVDAFCQTARVLGERLGPIRIKAPQARDDGFLMLLLGSLPDDMRFVLDLRHPSWDAPDVVARLDERAVARVNAWDGAASFRYLRLREPPYDEAALARWARRLRALADEGLEVYAYFKHEDEPTGAAYAERVLRLAAGYGSSRPPKEGEMEAERDAEQALDEIGEKRAEGEEPSEEERRFLEAERVPTESDAAPDRFDEGRGTPTY